jgi:hypothetical protein
MICSGLLLEHSNILKIRGRGDGKILSRFRVSRFVNGCKSILFLCCWTNVNLHWRGTKLSRFVKKLSRFVERRGGESGLVRVLKHRNTRIDCKPKCLERMIDVVEMLLA